jgi:5-methyltetrahydrofolate--homocysteine methyltransferase
LPDDLLQRIASSFSEIASVGQVKELVETALAAGISPVEIMHSMSEGLAKIGRKYEAGEFFLSELIMAGIMAQEVSMLLKPHLSNAASASLGKVVIGTVKGDIHDLGKNLVSMMLTSAGLEIVDLGVDVSDERFLVAVKEENPQIVAMSCLLTAAMSEMKNIIDRLAQTGNRNRVKVLVGGRPITASFAKEIGADGYGEDAVQAVNAVKVVLGK